MGAAEKIDDKELLNELFAHGPLLKIVADQLRKTIASYTSTNIQTGKPVLQEKTVKQGLAVAGLIRFESKDFSIELMLGFSSEIFFFLYENMFQISTEEINSENHDLAGEILNIAFGGMDPELKRAGHHMRASLPKIYSGSELVKVMARIDSRAISIPYTCDGKKFTVNIYSANSLHESWKFTSELP